MAGSLGRCPSRNPSPSSSCVPTLYTLFKVGKPGESGAWRTLTVQRPRRVPSSRWSEPAHMHVGSVLVFEGAAPPYDEFVAKLEQRLHLVPRYRQKLAFPPLVQGRPVWIDDPHFNAHYHVRHTALPAPAGEEELRSLAGHPRRGALPPAAVGRPGCSPASARKSTGRTSTRPIDAPRRRRAWTSSTTLFDLGHLLSLTLRRPDPRLSVPAAAHSVADAPSAPPTPLGASVPPPSSSAPSPAVARRSPGSRRWPPRGSPGAPPSPLNVRIGSHRRFGVGRRRPGALQGDQVRARRHRQRRRARRRHRRAARVRDPAVGRVDRGGHGAEGRRRWFPRPTTVPLVSAVAWKAMGRRRYPTRWPPATGLIIGTRRLVAEGVRGRWSAPRC